jgi:hypothetical protein
LHEVDGGDDIVDAEAEEGFADEFGAKFGEVEGAEDGGLGLFIAWWTGARSDDEDCGAGVGEGAESLRRVRVRVRGRVSLSGREAWDACRRRDGRTRPGC